MRLERLDADEVARRGGPAAAARDVRGLVPGGASVEDRVAEIIAAVRDQGDEAVLRLTRELDTRGADPPPLLVPPEELDEARRWLPSSSTPVR